MPVSGTLSRMLGALTLATSVVSPSAVAGTAASAGSALFESTEALTQEEFVRAAIARNPALPAAQAAWRAQRARIEVASSLDDPQLSYGIAPRTLDRTGTDLGQRIELSQRLPWPGKLRARGERAAFRAEAARESIASVHQEVAAAARAAFAEWYYVHEALRINRHNQDLWEEFKQIAETQYATGRVPQQDALRAAVERTRLRHQALLLRRERQRQRAVMNVLLNRSPETELPAPVSLGLPQRLPAAAELRKIAQAARPELKAIDATLHAAGSEVKLARLGYYPDFHVTAGYNSLWELEEKRWTVGVGINVPLGRAKRRAAVDAEQAEALQLRWERDDALAEIAGEVQQAYDAAQEAEHVIALYREQLVPLAEQTLDAAVSDYQAGRGDFLDLVSAERSLIETQLAAVRALSDYHKHLATLAQRSGGAELLPLLKEIEQ